MFTNTYRPHVGGVAHAVASTTEELRRQGHEVLIVCPEFPGTNDAEGHVVRVPALQRFNGSDFSVALPVSVGLRDRIDAFRPEVIHSHHPFLLGDTAVRLAAEARLPLVFTHHTLYERYTHYVPADSPQLRRFVAQLAIGYGALTSRVIAPSESIAHLLRARGLTAPIDVIPTGIAPEVCRGDRDAARRRWCLPADSFVVGHVGRLAPEKNLEFLAEAVGRFLADTPAAYFLVVGDGPSRGAIEGAVAASGGSSRLRCTGTLSGQDLADAYAAMDVFAFASTSETQGLVLIEAMANGVYAVALDASGSRDVIVDGRNGDLVRSPDRDRFRGALGRFYTRYAGDARGIRTAVRESVEELAIERTVHRLVDTYRAIAAQSGAPSSVELGGWSAFLRRLEAEWSLLSNMAGSVVGTGERPSSSARSTGPPSSRERTADPPGLILVQIDGLARTEFERALNHGRLPFLRQLLARANYEAVSFYSGLPSTTPAVQGELFYGVKGCVPAFEYFDRAHRDLVRMFSAIAACRVEAQLEKEGASLLHGGSSYSNIYGGGGLEARYCATTFTLERLQRVEHPREIIRRAYWYVASACRLTGLLVIESALAVGDFIHGLCEGFPWRHEAMFVPTRVLICVLLRELVTLSARIDIRRKLPIIHLNYLGYDEQAHRRGPDSTFAHWALKGIDRSIRRLVTAGNRAGGKRYEVWIYADHGQERTIPYEVITGRTIGEAVEAVFEERVETPPRFLSETIELFRSGHRTGARLTTVGPSGEPKIIVSAMGPLGHIYLPKRGSDDLLGRRCGALVEKAGVPLVLTRLGGRTWAFSPIATGPLREVGSQVLGERHPFRTEVVEDLERLCAHPDAGDVVIAGWRPEGAPLSFVLEWGAHGGPGASETHGFALLPAARLPRGRRLRPSDLRRCVERFRGDAVSVSDGEPPHNLSSRTGATRGYGEDAERLPRSPLGHVAMWGGWGGVACSIVLVLIRLFRSE